MAKRILIIDGSSRKNKFLRLLDDQGDDCVEKSDKSDYIEDLKDADYDIIVCHLGHIVGDDAQLVATWISELRGLIEKSYIVAVSEGDEHTAVAAASGAAWSDCYDNLMSVVQAGIKRYPGATIGDVIYRECQRLMAIDHQAPVFIARENNVNKVGFNKSNVFILTESSLVRSEFEQRFKEIDCSLRYIAGSMEGLQDLLIKYGDENSCIILDTKLDTHSKVRLWMWDGIRLNEKIGEAAFLPIVVMGCDKNFFNNHLNEAFVFWEMGGYHQFVPKPCSIVQFQATLNRMGPLTAEDLDTVVKYYAKDNVIKGYMHRLEKVDVFTADQKCALAELKKRTRLVQQIKKMPSCEKELEEAEKLLEEFMRNVQEVL
ncbi:MAG: hypothetical protein KC900_09935 [Candidatus Omnitrophica bacterium]|nr:hypothetical protein [Candidatus Omnitrophota bacterium]